MADEKTGLLSGFEPSAPPPPYSQPAVSSWSDQGDVGHPQTGQYPSQQAGRYQTPQGGYYSPQQFPQQGYISQQAQTSGVAAPQHQTMIYQQAPQDYMNRAIFVTICCFWPTGILAIMKASDARQALARGDIASAQASSESARKLTMISIIAGVLSIVIVCIIKLLTYWNSDKVQCYIPPEKYWGKLVFQ